MLRSLRVAGSRLYGAVNRGNHSRWVYFAVIRVIATAPYSRQPVIQAKRTDGYRETIDHVTNDRIPIECLCWVLMLSSLFCRAVRSFLDALVILFVFLVPSLSVRETSEFVNSALQQEADGLLPVVKL